MVCAYHWTRTGASLQVNRLANHEDELNSRALFQDLQSFDTNIEVCTIAKEDPLEIQLLLIKSWSVNPSNIEVVLITISRR